MKKLIAIVMLLIYMLGVTGVATASHFCCGKLSSINIEYTFSSIPNYAVNHTTTGCCRNTSHFYKVHDAHQQPAIDIIIKAPIAQATALFPVFTKLFPTLQLPFINALHGPPLLGNAIPLYIHLSVFRI